MLFKSILLRKVPNSLIYIKINMPYIEIINIIESCNYFASFTGAAKAAKLASFFGTVESENSYIDSPKYFFLIIYFER